MDLLTGALATAIAKAMLTAAGKELGGSAGRQARERLFGNPQKEALELALRDAWAEFAESNRGVVRDFDLDPSFLQFEAAAELAKVMVPGSSPSPVALAEAAVDSLPNARALKPQDRSDWQQRLRWAFVDLVRALEASVRRQPVLTELITREDARRMADAVEALAPQARTPLEEARGDYLRWVHDTNRYLRTTGIVSHTPVDIALNLVFVDLACRVDTAPGDRSLEWVKTERERLDRARDAGELPAAAFAQELDRLTTAVDRIRQEEQAESEPTTLLAAVSRWQHLLVLGEPGSGKTTLLRFLALAHADTALAGGLMAQRPDGDRLVAEPLVPILVRLGEFARSPLRTQGLGQSLAVYCRNGEYPGGRLEEVLSGALQRGRALVLLDGLDEVASAADRVTVVKAVERFVDTHSRAGNRFVVTSRIGGYQAVPLSRRFDVVRIDGMDDAAIGAFLDAYCPEIERADKPLRVAAADARRSADGLKEALAANPGVRRLAANPLLLTALLLVHRAKGRLPHRRVEAYVEVAQALAHTWRTVQGVPESELPDDQQLKAWLTRVGAWLHETRPEGSATRRELLPVLGPLWARQTGQEWDPAVLDLAEPLDTPAGRGVSFFLEQADKSSGLLIERAPGRFGFPHLTFEEYFTARSLAFEGNAVDRPRRIRRHLFDPRYQEPILLAFGLLGQQQAEELERYLNDVLLGPVSGDPQVDELAAFLGWNHLFALKLIADDTVSDAKTRRSILAGTVDLWLGKRSPVGFSRFDEELLRHWRALDGSRGAADLTELCVPHLAGVRGRGALSPRLASLLRVVLRYDSDDHAASPPTAQIISSMVDVVTDAATDPGVRVRAGEVLTSAGTVTEPAIHALVDILTDPTTYPNDRIGAARVLESAGPLPGPAISRLVDIVTDPTTDPDTHIRAGHVLASAETLPEPAVQALVYLVTDPTTDPETCIRFGQALASAGPLPEPALQALVNIVTDPTTDPETRVQAGQELANAGPLPEPALQALVNIATDPTINFPNYIWIGQSPEDERLLPEPAIQALVNIATDPTTDPDTHIRAGEALANAGPLPEPALQALVQIVTDPTTNPHTRIRAGSVLASAGPLPEPAFQALVQIVTDPTTDPDTRIRAGRALANRGPLPDLVFEALIRILSDPKTDPDTRIKAGQDLVAAGPLSEPTISRLVDIVTDPTANPDTRIRAGQVLANAGPLLEPAFQALVDILTNPNTGPETRTWVGYVMAHAGTVPEPAISRLLDIVTDPTTGPDTRVWIGQVLLGEEALPQLGLAPYLAALSEPNSWSDRRRDGLLSLKRFSLRDEDVASVLEFLKDEDNDVRSAAGLLLSSVVAARGPASRTVLTSLHFAATSPDFAEADGVWQLDRTDDAFEALDDALLAFVARRS